MGGLLTLVKIILILTRVLYNSYRILYRKMPKLIKRKLMDNLLDSLDKKFISILVGPRQVGKTTLLKMLIQEIEKRTHKKIIYLNLDDVTIRARLSQDPVELRREIERWGIERER